MLAKLGSTSCSFIEAEHLQVGIHWGLLEDYRGSIGVRHAGTHAEGVKVRCSLT
jgi:hypothetical protein